MRDYDQQKAVLVVQASLSGLRINAKRAITRKYLRGLGNLCSSAAHNQLTFVFNTISCGLRSRAAYNRVNTVFISQPDQWNSNNFCFVFSNDFCFLNFAHAGNASGTQGVTRLDGARSKKQVWRPHVRTWALSEANVPYWRKYLWHCWDFSGPPAVIGHSPQCFDIRGICSPFPSLRPCRHVKFNCMMQFMYFCIKKIITH